MDKEKNKNEIITKILEIVNDEKIQDPTKELLSLEKKFSNDVAIKQAIGQSFLRQGDNKGALKYMKEALEIEPNNYAVHFNLGKLYQKFKKFDEAIIFYKKSVSLNIKFKQGFNILGDIYFNKKDFKTAIDYYKNSFDIDKSKDNVFAILRLGQCLLCEYSLKNEKSLLKDAKAYYEFANKLEPNNNIILKNIININNQLGLKRESILIEKSINGVYVIDKMKKNLTLEY
jgi:tetratricopeptide (TPR) repeat protein